MGGVLVGMKIVTGTCSTCPDLATAMPVLPPEAVISRLHPLSTSYCEMKDKLIVFKKQFLIVYHLTVESIASEFERTGGLSVF